MGLGACGGPGRDLGAGDLDQAGAEASESGGEESGGSESSGGEEGNGEPDDPCLDTGCEEEAGGDEPEPEPEPEPLPLPEELCDVEVDPAGGCDYAEPWCRPDVVCNNLTVFADEDGGIAFDDPDAAMCMLDALRFRKAGLLNVTVEADTADSDVSLSLEILADETIIIRRQTGESCSALYYTWSVAEPQDYFYDCQIAEDDAGKLACILDPVTDACADAPVCPED